MGGQGLSPSSAARAAEKAGGFDRAAWDELAELGLCGLYVPEDDGGMGMGPVEGMVVMEKLGRGIVLEPLAQSPDRRVRVLAGYADAATKAAWLPGIASGEKPWWYWPTRSARPATSWTLCAGKSHASPRRLCVERYEKRSTGGSHRGRRLHRRRPRSTASWPCSWSSADRLASRTRGYGTQDGGRARRSWC